MPLCPHLLKSVLADPDDDGVRLIAADWLEQYDEPERAEFIRVQLQLAKALSFVRVAEEQSYSYFDPSLGPFLMTGPAEVETDITGKPTGRDLLPLRRRERELLTAHGQDWLLPLAAAIGVSTAPGTHKGNRYRFIGTQHLAFDERGRGVDMEWRRGFIEHVTMTAGDWLTHTDSLLAAHPVREVTLTTLPNLLQRSQPTNQVLFGYPVFYVYWRLWDGGREVGGLSAEAAVPRLLAAEWPGIKFTLPPHVDFRVPPAGTETLTWRPAPGGVINARDLQSSRRRR